MTTESRPRVLLDCDPGLDDAVAIALAVRHTDLVGLSTVGGNVGLDRTTSNALSLCDILKVEELPVHAGHDMPIGGSLEHRATEYHGPDGTGSVELPDATRNATSHDAVDWIVETIRGEEGLAVIATGPLTNIAHAFQAAPDIVDRIHRLSWMGGSSNAGNATAAAEFNCWVDPEAADIVFRAGLTHLTMVGLNVTHTVLLDRPWIDQLRADITDQALVVFADLLDYYEMRQRSMTTLAGAAVHDALAVLNVSHPDVLAGVRRPVEVVVGTGPARGMTLVDQRPKRDPDPATATVIEWADVERIRELVRDAFVEPK
ncbi:MAG: nucleoside hydrolase [Actinomycetia bacterium]|nr:nucleoside hydrolase [Actinomycetes bacterium]MCP5034043.1 nucleoside hydrolase [Actinomycetes bacterium]